MVQEVTDPGLLDRLNGAAVGKNPYKPKPDSLTHEQVREMTKDNPLRPPAPDFVGISKDGKETLNDKPSAFAGVAGYPEISNEVTDPALLNRLNASAGPRETTTQTSSPVGNTFQNIAAGAGKSITDLALGVKQRFYELQNYTSQGLPGSEVDARNLETVNQEVLDKRALDAPLMTTTAGKVGSVVGSAAPALAASLIPGGQGLAGSILTGGLLGAAEPTAGDESIVRNAAIGAGAGAAGYGVAKGVGTAAGKVLDARKQARMTNAAKDATVAASRDLGYVIPPASAKPGIVNQAIEGLAGKLSTAQKASSLNQETTNKIVARELGIPDGQKISIEVLNKIRADAGKNYETVKGLGTIKADGQYLADLDQIVAQARNVDRSFPGLGGNELEGIVTALRQPTFNAGDTVDAIKLLRKRADGFYARGDKELGSAFKSATGVLEDMLERAAEASGKPDILAKYLNARATIAKTYSVERALNDATGNVSAQKLGTQLSKGKPLSGDVKKVAQFGAQFPKAAREINESLPAVSPLDYAIGLGTGGFTGNPYGLAAIAARPIARSVILSRPYQRFMNTPNYNAPLSYLLNADPTQQGIRIGLMSGLPDLIK